MGGIPSLQGCTWGCLCRVHVPHLRGTLEKRKHVYWSSCSHAFIVHTALLCLSNKQQELLCLWVRSGCWHPSVFLIWQGLPCGFPCQWWGHFWDVGSTEILTPMRKFVQITGTILLQLVVFVYRVCFLRFKFCKEINLYRNVKLLLIALLLTGQQLLTDSVATAVRYYKEKLPLWRSLPPTSASRNF